MSHRILISAISLGLALGLLTGCERESESTTATGTTTPADQPATTPAPTPATPAYQPAQTDATTTTAQADGQQHNATGTITSVDSEGSTVTVEHQAVASLNWPAMTMTFEVQDPSQLQDLQAGDQVEFAFVDAGNNRYLIQQISEQSAGSQLSQQDEDAATTDDQQ